MVMYSETIENGYIIDTLETRMLNPMAIYFDSVLPLSTSVEDNNHILSDSQVFMLFLEDIMFFLYHRVNITMRYPM